MLFLKYGNSTVPNDPTSVSSVTWKPIKLELPDAAYIDFVFAIFKSVVNVPDI